MSDDNIGPGPRCRDSGLRDYDRLPPELRRYFANAPYDYAVRPTAAAIRKAQRARGAPLLPHEIERGAAVMLKAADANAKWHAP